MAPGSQARVRATPAVRIPARAGRAVRAGPGPAGRSLLAAARAVPARRRPAPTAPAAAGRAGPGAPGRGGGGARGPAGPRAPAAPPPAPPPAPPGGAGPGPGPPWSTGGGGGGGRAPRDGEAGGVGSEGSATMPPACPVWVSGLAPRLDQLPAKRAPDRPRLQLRGQLRGETAAGRLRLR